jgi:hypothetical protein
MRVLPDPRGRRPQAVGCDQNGCDEKVAGEIGDKITMVRWRAQQRGWMCNNPGPGRPASDLCPRHLNTEGAA